MKLGNSIYPFSKSRFVVRFITCLIILENDASDLIFHYHENQCNLTKYLRLNLKHSMLISISIESRQMNTSLLNFYGSLLLLILHKNKFENKAYRILHDIHPPSKTQSFRFCERTFLLQIISASWNIYYYNKSSQDFSL